MSKPKVTDLVAVEDYYSNVDDEYVPRYDSRVPALENRKVNNDLVVVENYYPSGDDERSNSYGGTAHDVPVPVPVPDNHPLDRDDPSPVPKCVVKLKSRLKAEPAVIEALLHRRLKRLRLTTITLDVEENTVAFCGNVNPATIAWTVSDCAGVGAELVFYKNYQGIRRPPDCENIVFRVYGHYSNLVKEELQNTKGINSVIIDRNISGKLWMSISGDGFNGDEIHDRMRKLCDCPSERDIKEVLSYKRANKRPNAANDMTNIFEGNGALASIQDPKVSNTLPKNHRADESQITVDFIVPRNHQRECATEINNMLLSTKGVRFVINEFRASRLASVKVCGDDNLELDTILKAISSAGGIKPRVRKSLISQLALAFACFVGN